MSAISLDHISSTDLVESRILLMDSTSAFVPDEVISANLAATELLRFFLVLLELTSMEVSFVLAATVACIRRCS